LPPAPAQTAPPPTSDEVGRLKMQVETLERAVALLLDEEKRRLEKK
jgi:hypothetical protein